jgi:glucose-1-phosphate thymidylyltransferase
MKGIILAGGNGRRLEPITNVTNKHLLAVYDKPLIYYPLQKLLDAGIKDIMIISGKEHAGVFLKLLGSGKDFNCRFSYEVQSEAGGIAQALALAEDFAGGENCMVVLGDNIFEDDFAEAVKEFDGQKGARIFLKEVPDPHRFGVAELSAVVGAPHGGAGLSAEVVSPHGGAGLSAEAVSLHGGAAPQVATVLSIEEKPKNPKTNFAVTGLYMYDSSVFEIIRSLKPSARGELEITDVNNHYISGGNMKARFVEREWTDAGTFESLFRANRIARKLVLAKRGVNADQLVED